MKRLAFALTIFAFSASVSAGDPPKRPRILGIASVTILVSDMPAAVKFYQGVTDPAHSCTMCEELPSRFFSLPSGQRIGLESASPNSQKNLLAEISFRVDDLGKLKNYLKANSISFEEIKSKTTKDIASILVQDPEGHHLFFIGPEQTFIAAPQKPDGPVRIIHAGFVVKDRVAEDRFYKDILGFHVYWHGGMKEGEDHWIDMQVPDGTDWIEYMLNIPADASHKTLGVMNHIALGVPDIHAAEAQLRKNGWTGTEQPKIGRDGKWQLNLYDPDDTRVELMEFTPVQKPCCSEYTGPHPKP
jgi:catechol 2,3-dioxygenase-like lactoylglutathione lyase family enzyme